jgi:hypothetical protein
VGEAVSLPRAPSWPSSVAPGSTPSSHLRCLGAHKRPEITGDEHLSKVEWRVAARKGVLKTMTDHDRALESRKASVRAKVEHPFLVVKRDFGFTKTRYRGIAKNRNHLHMLFASANWLMRARARRLDGVTARRQPARNRPAGPEPGARGRVKSTP